jgi:hypothetical protein
LSPWRNVGGLGAGVSGEDGEEEETLGQRVAALEMARQPPAKEGEHPGGTQAPATASSITVLLTQALQR